MTGMNKKGQGAMEYLMTYGWAILVVMIVGIVLWQLGIFGGSGSQSKTFTGFSSGVKPLSWTMLANGSGTVTFVNAEGTVISAGDTGCMANATKGNGQATIASNQEFTRNITCASGTSGAGYSANMSLDYNKTIGIVTETHKASGVLKGSYE